MHRKITTAFVAVLTIVALGAADCDNPPAKDTPKAPTKAAAPPAVPNPTVNHPGPQADPGQCIANKDNPDGKRSVLLEAHWTSETRATPTVTWSHNGVETPATNLHSTENGPARGWGGEWSTLQTGQCLDWFSVRIVGTPSTYAVICMVSDLGKDIIKTGERNCNVAYTLP